MDKQLKPEYKERKELQSVEGWGGVKNGCLSGNESSEDGKKTENERRRGIITRETREAPCRQFLAFSGEER